MKAIWSGAISFGLVEIPIKLFSAVTPHIAGFTMLCGICHHPIKYKRWCEHCQKEVQWNNIVKGLQIKKGTYFVLTQEHIHKLKPITTERISIVEFVDYAAIDPLFWQTPYYVAPAKQRQKAYHLLLQALQKTEKVAIGTFVMRDKEHVCSIMAHRDILLLTTLYYSYEIKPAEFLIEATTAKITSAELTMAIKLIQQLSHKKFDISKFKDTFAQRLSALLKAPKGRKIKIKEEKIPKLPKEKNLLTLLQSSLKEKGKTAVVRARA